MDIKTIIAIGAEVGGRIAKEVSDNDNMKKTIFGTYSDGSPRSMSDMISGEIVSPEDRLAITRKIEKHEKKKEKKKKKGKKYAKIDLDKLAYNNNNK